MKNKILFVNGHMGYGGVEKSLLNILRNINYDKYEVDLLLIEGQGDYFENIPPSVTIIFKNLNNTHGSFLESIAKCLKKKDLLGFFTRIIISIKKSTNVNLLKLLRIPLLGYKTYDIAIAFRYGFCTDIVEFAVNAKKKTTWWHHGEINLSNKQIKEYELTCVKLKNIVVVSKASEQMLVEAMPPIRKYLTVIPNMIDNKYIDMMALKFIPNFNKEKQHFVTACRIAPEKHIENVIYASEILIQRGFTNFLWHVIGDGDGLIEMKKFSKIKKTDKYILFEGKKANPYPYIKNADFYISSSYIESQGLSILEAMALNTPCIIADNAGIRDYANINNSIIVGQGAESLATGIFDIIHDSKRRNLLKLNTKCPDRFISINIIKITEEFLQIKS
jgi:glycosyltransferase involved in cell wall biosynthesis